jgi:hypothetical protein
MKRLLLLLLIPMFGLTLRSAAQGDLLITPTRVVFEGNKQKEEMNIVNIGKDTATYTISFLQYNMKEDGSFVAIDKPEPGQMFADPYLRIFPRKVTLAPREPQVIVMQCRRKSDMPAGEYRSHLYFRAEKDLKPLGMGNASADSTKVNVKLVPIYGLSIPVIIRSGEVNVSVTLSDLQLDNQPDDMHNLKISINRSGNISVYGDILVQYIPEHGNAVEIGQVKGVGVYSNLNKRNLTLKLNNVPGVSLNKGKLKVQYTGNGDAKKTVFAEQELPLN